MRSAASSRPYASIIGKHLKRYWSLPLLYTASMFLAVIMPVMLLDETESSKQSLAGITGQENPLAVFLIVCIAVSAGLMYEYLERKISANYMHSLPVTRTQLFFGTLAAQMIVSVIPVAVTAAALIAMGAGVSASLLWVLNSVVMIAATLAITVLACMISGNVLMTLFNICFLNGVVPMTLFLADASMNEWIEGYVRSDILEKILINSLPAVSLATGAGIIKIAAWALFAAVVIAVSLMIYKKRPIERSGDSLVFGWTKAALLTVVTFLGAAFAELLFLDLFGKDSIAGVVAALIAVLSIFIVMSILIYRTPKVLTKSGIVCAALTIALIAGYNFGFSHDVLGIETKAPGASEVEKVSVEAICHENGPRYDGNLFKGNKNGNIYLEDRQNVEAACDLQKVFAEYLKSGSLEGSDAYTQAGGAFDVSMKLKNGRSFDRSYSWERSNKAINDEAEKYLAVIYESSEYKEKFSFSKMKACDSMIVYGSGTLEADEEESVVSLDRKQQTGLLAAMDKDFQSRTYKQETQTVKKGYDPYSIEMEFGGDNYQSVTLTVLPTDKYTLEWIKKNI